MGPARDPATFRSADVTIGHLKPDYMAPFQTFIYTYLSHWKAFPPFVLTDVARNLEAFLCRVLI